jgi:hypothetical protein
MTQSISLKIEFTGENRTVISNKNPASPKTFFILGAYAELPGKKYPQAIEIFCGKAEDIKPAGVYMVPLVASVKDNRPSFELDISAAVPAQKVAA